MTKFFFAFFLLAAAVYPEAAKTPCPTCMPPCATNPSLKQGDEALKNLPIGQKFPAAYTHPGAIQVQDESDVYFTGSYLFWCIQQEGLNIATTAYIYQNMPGFIEPSETDGYAVFQKTNYTQGFKVGFGTNLTSDGWVFDVEGTRICQTTHTRSKIAPSTTEGTGVFKISGWFNETEVTQDVVANKFTSKWDFELDWIDIGFKRPSYEGRRLIIAPSTGIRAARIWQRLKVTALNAYHAYNTNPAMPVTDISQNYSHSWAIGPRGLVDLHWLFGAGFRMQGNFGASLLFTKYTKVFHKETGTVLPSEFILHNYTCLRPMAEANIGLGWGSYLCYQRRHLDISVTYDFNYLWNQNMLKFIAEINGTGNGSQANDLFLYGLTVKGRFDF